MSRKRTHEKQACAMDHVRCIPYHGTICSIVIRRCLRMNNRNLGRAYNNKFDLPSRKMEPAVFMILRPIILVNPRANRKINKSISRNKKKHPSSSRWTPGIEPGLPACNTKSFGRLQQAYTAHHVQVKLSDLPMVKNERVADESSWLSLYKGLTEKLSTVMTGLRDGKKSSQRVRTRESNRFCLLEVVERATRSRVERVDGSVPESVIPVLKRKRIRGTIADCKCRKSRLGTHKIASLTMPSFLTYPAPHRHPPPPARPLVGRIPTPAPTLATQPPARLEPTPPPPPKPAARKVFTAKNTKVGVKPRNAVSAVAPLKRNSKGTHAVTRSKPTGPGTFKLKTSSTDKNSCRGSSESKSEARSCPHNFSIVRVSFPAGRLDLYSTPHLPLEDNQNKVVQHPDAKKRRSLFPGPWLDPESNGDIRRTRDWILALHDDVWAWSRHRASTYYG
ncbi:hypothetical protein C8R43DRAFT_951928 [Mycena crocata]|nr:hypothetical protein C8R43DRAFT_951928 [Mycena crocata]